MNISVEKLYEFLDTTTILMQGDILELLDDMLGKNTTKVRCDGEIYDLSADKPKQEPCEDVVSRKAVVEWLMTASDDSIEEAIDTNLRFLKSSTIFFPAPKTESCVSIPKDATNGDVFKMVFPSLKAKTSSASEYDMMVKFPESYAIITKNWWNAPYKRGGEE